MGKFKSECGNTIQWVLRKLKKKKVEVLPAPAPSNNQPNGVQVATIAIVLDGEVQEVIRAQDRMAALFLSEPSFVEIPDDLEVKPTIGWKYKDGEFWSKETKNPEVLTNTEAK
jgi:hypothetical protein